MKKEKFLKRPNSGSNIQNKDKSKDLIIKNLENKISLQEEKISQLMEYKTLYENKLKLLYYIFVIKFNNINIIN